MTQRGPIARVSQALALSFAVFSVALMTSCVAPKPRARVASATTPTIVSRPAHAKCDQQALARATPWTGRIVQRRIGEAVEDSSRTVRTEWVLCGETDERACTDWATNAGTNRARKAGLEFAVVPGHSDRGKIWVLKIGAQEEAHLFRTNREFVTFFRDLQKSGADPQIITSDHVTETRYGRVEIVYRTPVGTSSRPNAAWLYEVASESQAVQEGLLAFEDLEAQGIELTSESWADLRALARSLGTQRDRTPEFGAPRGKARGLPVQIWLDARCFDDG